MADPITVELVLDDKQFVASIKSNGQVLNSLSRQVDTLDDTVRRGQSGLAKYTHGIRGLMVDIGLLHHTFIAAKQMLTGWQESIVRANADFEKARVLMMGMSNATDDMTRSMEASANVNFMIQKAMSNPFGITAIQDAMVKLKSVGLEPTAGAARVVAEEVDGMNRSLKKTDSVNIQALFDAVARFGGTEDQLHRASIAIQQMAGKGVISMEELRQQLGEAIPNAVQVMADSLNLSYSELVDRIAKGQVSAKPALVRFFQELEAQVGGSAQRMMQTWDGLMAQFNTSFDLFKKNIGDAGYMDALKSELRAIMDIMNSEAGMAFAQSIGEALAALIRSFTALREWITANRNEIAAFAEVVAYAAGASAIMKVVAGLGAMTTALRAASAGGMIRRVVDDVGMLGLVFTSARGDIAAAAGAMGKAKTAAGLLGIAFRALTGPIGWIITAGALVIAFWEDEEEAIRENTKELVENAKSRELLTEKTVEQMRQAKALLEAELTQIQANARARVEYLNKTQNINSPTGQLQDDTQLASLVERATEIREQIEALQQGVARGTAQVIERAADRAFNEVQQQIGSKLQALRDEYNQWIAANREAMAAGDPTALSEKMELMLDIKQREIDLIGEAIDETMRQIELKRQAEDATGVEVLNARLAKLNEAYQRATEAKRALSEQPDFLTQGSVNAGSGDNISKRIDGLRAKMEQFKEELRGATKEAAKAAGAIEALFPTATQEQKTLYLDLAKQVDELARRLKLLKTATKDIKDGQEDLGVAMSRATSDYQEAIRTLNEPFGVQASSRVKNLSAEVNRLNDSVAALRIEAKKTDGLEAAQFNAVADELARVAAGYDAVAQKVRQADLVNATGKMQASAREWTQSTMTQREQIVAEFEADMAQMRELMLELSASGEQSEAVFASLQDSMRARTAKLAEDTKSSLEKLADDWSDVTMQMDEATARWAQSSADAITDFVMTGKGNFADLADAIIRDLIRIQIQQALAPAFAAIGSAFFPNLGNPMAAGNPGFVGPPAPFANGGIMTGNGPVPLRQYAAGGIANSPQLAMFGEGSQPEAYVPLPDGRTIPVTVTNMGRQEQGMPNIQVNVINQSGQPVKAEQEGGRFDGKQFVLDVVLSGMSAPGRFRDGMKDAMR